MTGGVLGGGVIFVVAAVLWAAVLVPAWVRRREFRAAEQNAIRLQRTLRVLAETAEVPTEVRVEATAREALAQEKLLRTAQRRQEAERQAKLAEARAARVRAEIKAQQVKRQQAALVRVAKLQRPWVRRLRSLTALIAVAAIVTALVGAGLAVAGQGVAVLVGAALGFVAASGALVLMAPGRAKLIDIPAEHAADLHTREALVSEPVSTVSVRSVTESDEQSRIAHLKHVAAQSAAGETLDRAKLLARARAEAKNRAVDLATPAGRDREETSSMSAADDRMPSAGAGADAIDRSARRAANAASYSQASRLPVAEQLRQMGVVGDTREGMPDLDAALRRHRNAS